MNESVECNTQPRVAMFKSRCSSYETDAEDAMKQCRAMLGESNIDKAVRYGDIYGLMIQHYARLQQWKAVSVDKLKNKGKCDQSKKNGCFGRPVQ